jgi:hypothetical protein
MTDNDIIKALECCRDFGDCSLCPYEKATFENEADCAQRMHTDALDLINRQKAEIDRLEKQIKELLISETCELYIPMEIACRVRKGHPIFKAIKSEVAKEFAERLKAKAQFSEDFGDAAVSYDDIDNIVKEMTEEHYETQ